MLELRKTVSSNHNIIEVKNNDFQGYDVVFDLNFDDGRRSLESYADLKDVLVVVCAVKQSLEQALMSWKGALKCTLLGMNSISGFIDRPLKEMTTLDQPSRQKGDEILGKLDFNISWVESKVGMVSPRVICMIINEAYYTLEEGTASKADIDTGMKLGTAYPHGPFEWSEKIGLQNVYDILQATYRDTGEGRYKICGSLKREVMQQQLG